MSKETTEKAMEENEEVISRPKYEDKIYETFDEMGLNELLLRGFMLKLVLKP